MDKFCAGGGPLYYLPTLVHHVSAGLRAFFPTETGQGNPARIHIYICLMMRHRSERWASPCVLCYTVEFGTAQTPSLQTPQNKWGWMLSGTADFQSLGSNLYSSYGDVGERLGEFFMWGAKAPVWGVGWESMELEMSLSPSLRWEDSKEACWGQGQLSVTWAVTFGESPALPFFPPVVPELVPTTPCFSIHRGSVSAEGIFLQSLMFCRILCHSGP